MIISIKMNAKNMKSAYFGGLGSPYRVNLTNVGSVAECLRTVRTVRTDADRPVARTTQQKLSRVGATPAALHPAVAGGSWARLGAVDGLMPALTTECHRGLPGFHRWLVSCVTPLFQ
jgi:hypothetical protein